MLKQRARKLEKESEVSLVWSFRAKQARTEWFMHAG